ncbi:cell-death-related nuclease 7-like isoform X1 [Dermacentor variabilis]|uniref:cell-death-related nuclease 7-like isoform X1 n=1 Tax=Dermacentor variabilis TaxID=34621 RepID=UPI003F5C12D8
MNILLSVFLSPLCFTPEYVFGKGKVSCKDAAGMDVDWFVLYKLPKTSRNNKASLKLYGGEMAYYDSFSQKPTWKLLPSDIYNDLKNPVTETLKPIFGKKPEKGVGAVVYNDQPPKNFSGTRAGHSKGVLMAGKGKYGGTVWLQHSVPRFLEHLEQGYVYPTSGRENGQLFLCLSMELEAVEVVARHLQVQAANVYQRNVPEWAKNFPEFWKILNKNYMRSPKDIKVDFLKTLKMQTIIAIAKPPNWQKDVYTEGLRDQVKDNITVQSWRNGAGGAEDTYCTRNYSVRDVNMIGVQTSDGYAEFGSSEDHSKWCVAQEKGIFCVSSLNRMNSQKKRGGEVTCLLDDNLAQLFRNTIAESTKCK